MINSVNLRTYAFLFPLVYRLPLRLPHISTLLFTVYYADNTDDLDLLRYNSGMFFFFLFCFPVRRKCLISAFCYVHIVVSWFMALDKVLFYK